MSDPDVNKMDIEFSPVASMTLESSVEVPIATTTTTTESTTTTADNLKPTATEEAPKKHTVPPRPLGPDGLPISKSAHKKLIKLQRLAETRDQWKADKRQKVKERKARNREEREKERETVGLKRKAGSDEGDNSNVEEEEGNEEPAGKKVKKEDVKDGEDIKGGVEEEGKKEGTKRVVEDITLILDCGFDDKMHDREVVSMSSQLTRCYAFNRAAPRQFKISVTSLNGRLLNRFQTVLKNQHLHWKGVTFLGSEYPVTPENKDKLVYLTADSEDTVEDLEPGTSYIIGGIVDRNRYKGLCYNKAVAQGIRTAKLPIGDYIKMASRFVLTTNQVVEIMLKYLECRDWKEAFITVIPPRKQPAVRAPAAEIAAAKKAGEEGAQVKEEVEQKTE